MRYSNLFVKHFLVFAATTFIAILLIATPTRLRAQSAGNNAVYNSSGVTGSTAFIDASATTSMNGGATNLCAKINDALSIVPSPGTVIDARGVTNLACPSGDTPWSYGTNKYGPPAVILLPAGTITISNTWILPGKTRLIGEGSGASGTSLTTIQACATSGCFTDPDTGSSNGTTTMIRMGTTTNTIPGFCSSNCFAIGIEDLVLDGQGQAINGITNVYSQELSYVNRVDLYRITGTGLQIGYGTNQGAQNSGPYSNIRFETGSSTLSASTACAQIVAAGSTRGIHGLSCIAGTAGTATAAVYLDASSNSIEDVYVSGFSDGIRVGQNDAAQSNVILNINTPVTGGAAKLVHLCNPAAGTCPGTSATVSDLSVMAASSGCTSSGCATIVDDLTGTALTGISNAYTGMYVLGEATAGGYSRFTTSKTVPTWIVGSSSPSGSCNTGALYSNTSGTSGSHNTFWACAGATWGDVK
jgi:hypothetical protein